MSPLNSENLRLWVLLSFQYNHERVYANTNRKIVKKNVVSRPDKQKNHIIATIETETSSRKGHEFQ